MESTAELWLDFEGAVENLPLPVRTRAQVLPLASLPWQMRRDRFWTFPAETLRAVRDRLQRDGDSRQRLLDAMKASTEIDLITAGVRLLGATMPQRAQLAAWVSEKLATLGKSQGPADFGYDIIAGSYRPLQHCLLESCLTR